MARRFLLAASMIVLLASAIAGCSEDDSTGSGTPTGSNVAGRWKGTLSLAFLGSSPTVSGAVSVDFNQDGNNASGIAVWAPVANTQSIAGPIDGNAFTFVLSFVCPSNNGGVTLTGTVIDNNVINITGGSGIACFAAGADLGVAGAVGTITRDNTVTNPTDPTGPTDDVDSFLRFESVKIAKTPIDESSDPPKDGEFVLTGRIRNTGDQPLEIAVFAKAKNGDFALSDVITAETGVSMLDPGMYTTFEARSDRKFRSKVTWTYWGQNVTDDVETDEFTISK